MSNLFASIKNAAIKALGGKVPQEPTKAAPKVVYVERETLLSKPQGTEANNGKPVDAVERLHGNFVKTLPANAAKDGRLANALTGVEMLTQEAINAKLRADRQKAALKQERAVAKAIKQIDARRKDLALAVVVNDEKRDAYVEQTKEAAELNNNYIETRFNQPIDIQALAAQARKERAAQAAKRSTQAAANQGSKQPEVTQSKTAEQRQQAKPPVTKSNSSIGVNSLSDAEKRNIAVIEKFLVDKGCEKEFAARKAVCMATAANSQDASVALTGLIPAVRAELLPALVKMNKGVYGPLCASKKEETKVAPVNKTTGSAEVDPSENEVNPQSEPPTQEQVNGAKPRNLDAAPQEEGTQEIEEAVTTVTTKRP